MQPKTLYDKIWESHIVVPETDAPGILFVDLHLIHEVTSPQAFEELRKRGLRVRRTDLTLGTEDHSIPTTTRVLSPTEDREAYEQVTQLEKNCREFGIELHGLGSDQQGIVHVIGPELGITQPGKTIVCGDSHTSTHGAFGALAFGIGTTEVGYVLATQCLLQRKARNLEIAVNGTLKQGVTAKDVILYIISKIGTAGGTGSVIEYTGSTIRSLNMDGRMTVCNMSIEGGARAGMVAPDDTTFEYLAGRPMAPQGADWDKALTRWRRLPTDPGAKYDRTISFDAADIEPMISFGTNPGMTIPITGTVPNADTDEMRRALTYMGVEPGKPLLDHPIDVVFIGSCTNSRLTDLRAAAQILKGRKVAPSVRAVVVPGSQQIKKMAEAEGLDRIFKEAGADWRESGCSMCIAMNGDKLEPGQISVSTSNRNFEGRQGPGGRTLLASPLTAAASAITGRVTDLRRLGKN
ncbi:MAG TPA: 3-isopropylmalate dehydratase large subunit [Terriglobia bacterium]|nr:3-isopropylmalate dehydratase large subunit [Terriglobia bacterium]